MRRRKRSKTMMNENKVITETKEKREPRWLPCGHPDIQKKIDEVKAIAKARREQAAKNQEGSNKIK